MSNLVNALAIVLSISAMLILGGMVTSEIAGNDQTIMHCEGTIFDTMGECTTTGYILNTTNVEGKLPSTSLNPVNPTGVTGEEGIFTTVGAWILDKTGLSFLYNIITAPSTFLKSVGLKNPYADVIATIWYGLTLFLIISWWKGQDS